MAQIEFLYLLHLWFATSLRMGVVFKLDRSQKIGHVRPNALLQHQFLSCFREVT